MGVCVRCVCVRTPGESSAAAKSSEVASFFCLRPTPRCGDEIFTSKLDSFADTHVERKRKETAGVHVVCRLANAQEGASLLFMWLCLFRTGAHYSGRGSAYLHNFVVFLQKPLQDVHSHLKQRDSQQ